MSSARWRQPPVASLCGIGSESHLNGQSHGHCHSRGLVISGRLLDLYSRQVIGWAMSAKPPDQQVALQANYMTLAHCRPQPGLIHHAK
jgi:transposase InsO family protein